MSGIIHNAGPLIDGIQRCTRCGEVLEDLTCIAWPADEPPPQGFPEGPVTITSFRGGRCFETGEAPDAVRCGVTA